MQPAFKRVALVGKQTPEIAQSLRALRDFLRKRGCEVMLERDNHAIRVVGKVDVRSGTVTVKDAPGGRGPYGICATPAGEVWYCSLAGSFIARIDRRTGQSIVVEPPTKNQGARRVWSDSRGRIWVSEWNSGNLSMHDPAARTWRTWKLPGESPRAYAVYVDDRDRVWVADWSANAMFSFDQGSEKFEKYPFPREGANVRQMLATLTGTVPGVAASVAGGRRRRCGILAGLGLGLLAQEFPIVLRMQVE